MKRETEILLGVTVAAIALSGCDQIDPRFAAPTPTSTPQPQPNQGNYSNAELYIPSTRISDPTPTSSPTLVPTAMPIMPEGTIVAGTTVESNFISPLETTSTPEQENEIVYESVAWGTLNLMDRINVQNWESLIISAANRYQIPPEVIAVVIDTESHGRTDGIWAELEGDGVGLMGVMPHGPNFPNRPTREELFDPATNINTGTIILSQIYYSENLGNGDWWETFLWYNAGHEEKFHAAESYARHVFGKLGWIIPEVQEEFEKASS